jgi:hypothetical protein
MQFYLLLFYLLSTAYVDGWSLQVSNQVNPCPGRNYCTVKLFTANWQQKDLCRGTSSVLFEWDEQVRASFLFLGQTRVIDGSEIPSTGLGIQENGMYCRRYGNEGGCINPDNAGMQLVVNWGNCNSYQLNDPFYCGKHPPNAKNFVNVHMGGRWPNCKVTLTRKANAPGCNYSC